MKKCAVVLAVAVLLFFTAMAGVFANDIAWDDISGGNLALRTVLVNPDNPRIIYAGSSNAVLKSEDGAGSWRDILLIRGQDKTVNFLSFEPTDKNSLYAATGNGLFYSANQGEGWKRIFKGRNYLENECTVLAVSPDGIYLGTKGGLFVSKDKGRSWHKETAELGSSQILAVAYSLKEPNYLYVACIDGAFKSEDSGRSWKKIFIASSTESGDNEEEVPQGQEEERLFNLRYISIDPNNVNCLYLATSRGVYTSRDKGQNWEPLTSFGLLNQDVRFLLVSSESRLYAVTKSGIFEYKGERWQELSFGLAAGDIASLALDNRNILYAACDKGLFKANPVYFSNNGQDKVVSLYFENEPAINDLQEAAIKYAEVEPEKILRWRKQAARKALLPQVSVGVDRNTTDLWHWETGSSAVGQSGDDLLRRGRDSTEWDVTLSWNLGELIWNDDQTNIDVRSRLMVQLREDVLDEVTKLYFERIRVKMELDNLGIEDRKKRFEKELRLRELTAQLDGLTGGYFSKNKNG